jgi:hypothetical protein
MKLGEWIAKWIADGNASGKKDACRKLADKIRTAGGGSTVSTVTIENAAGGMRLSLYDKAKAISDATGGDVTITELCE